MDRISNLPDGVISQILSFLPTKKAARTSVLSKRWRVLFSLSPNLDLSEDKGGNRNFFIDFVNRVLAVSGNSTIKVFTLRCRKCKHITRWICNVLNRGVMVLALTIHFEDRSSSSLPFEVFTCKTIVKLELFGFLIEEVPEDAFLPSLKSIVLESVNFFSLHGCAFEKLLSACPVLEDLAIYDLNWEQWKWSRKVTSRSLKRLTIERSEFDGFDGTDFGSITFDTPSVTRLDYSDFVPGSYPSVNLDSLVEANLSLIVTVDHTWDFNYADENDHITSNPTNLFKGLKNVKIMNLLDQEILEMFYLFRGAIPVFQNLVHLSTVTISDHCWRGLLLLLNNSPNLETLTIEGTLHYDPIDCECLSGYSFLLSCPVKVLTITEYMGTIGEVEQLKHFLGKLSCLELLKVKVRVKDQLQITKDLLMLPRASSKCKIKVI